jgi:signal transduction histidine kinase
MPYIIVAFAILLNYFAYRWIKNFAKTPLSIPLLYDGASIISAFYAIVLFCRKIYYATSLDQVNAAATSDKYVSQKRGSHSLFKEFLNPSQKEIRAYRGFIIWLFFYLMVWILFIGYHLNLLGSSWPYLFHILLLVGIVQSVFVFLNYTTERNSFLAKLVWVILCVVLIILGLMPYTLFGDDSPTASEPHPEIQLRIFLILIPITTFIIVILLPLVFRYNILRPLKRVIDGVRKVNDGDLDANVIAEVNDEIGALSNDFNQMTQSLRQYSTKMEELVAKRTLQLEASLNDLKSTQAQLIQSEKMASLGELTAGIAHEIQNPLNFVNNFSEVNNELIEELKSEKSKVRSERDENLEDEILNDIYQNNEKINLHGKRADGIVKGMLQHSRSSTGQKELTDINKIADEYLRLSYHGMRAKDKSFNAEFKTDFDETVGKINVVPQDIGRVVLNLFNNAFYAVNERYMVEGRRQKEESNIYVPIVTVVTKKLNNSIEIKVSDNGNGIPQSIIDKIFQPFFTTKPTGQGTGLGLSLAYDIITKEHNGKIKVKSNEVEGTVFIIQLPV